MYQDGITLNWTEKKNKILERTSQLWNLDFRDLGTDGDQLNFRLVHVPLARGQLKWPTFSRGATHICVVLTPKIFK